LQHWNGSIAEAELGRFADAERTLLRCLDIREQVWGDLHRRDSDRARVLTTLAAVYVEMRRYDQAEKRG
jgi:hypothetical protein